MDERAGARDCLETITSVSQQIGGVAALSEGCSCREEPWQTISTVRGRGGLTKQSAR